MKIFTVFDSKAEAYLQPMFSPTPGTMLRGFEAAANSEEHDFHRHAEDYTLFMIGEWDEFKGEIVMFPAKVSLGTALEVIKNDIARGPVAVHGGE